MVGKYSQHPGPLVSPSNIAVTCESADMHYDSVHVPQIICFEFLLVVLAATHLLVWTVEIKPSDRSAVLL